MEKLFSTFNAGLEPPCFRHMQGHHLELRDMFKNIKLTTRDVKRFSG